MPASLTDLKPNCHDYVGLTKRPLLIGIGSDTVRCGKSHITALLVQMLNQGAQPILVSSCETSYPISSLVEIISVNKKMLAEAQLDSNAAQSLCESIISGWLVDVAGSRHYDAFQHGIEPFSAWLVTQLPELLPLLPNHFSATITPEMEAQKDRLRPHFYTPAAQKIIQAFGGGVLTALSWVKAVRKEYAATVSLIPGIRTEADCRYIAEHGGMIIRIQASHAALVERLHELHVKDPVQSLRGGWDCQLPELPEMLLIPNNYRNGDSKKGKEQAFRETELALSAVALIIANKVTRKPI